MEVIHKRCCGLDVHKKTVTACLIITEGGKASKEIRTFSTTTRELLFLLDWLKEAGCTHVAMESTGVYWKPIYNLFEDQFDQVLVVNAQHIKTVPGRKTDVKDAEWIADLLRHGLLRGSFIPPAPVRELRELTRHRTTLAQERARVVNRLQKVLEDANIKLASVVTDVMGVSATAMLRAMLEGQEDAEELVKLARGKLRNKKEALAEALTGRLKPHHRYLIGQHLGHIDHLEEMIEQVSSEIEERLRPFERDIELLDSIPGVARQTAENILAEVGFDISRFGSAQQLASWAGMCPGNNESAGRRKSGKTRKGSPWLRHTLIEAAHGASHTKDTYLSAQYHRLVGRRGKKKALVAVGHSILTIAYHLLTHGQVYQELGVNYFDEHAREVVQRRLVARLKKLGYEVLLEPTANAA